MDWEAHHADAAEDGVCTNPWEDVARQTSHCAHNQEKVHHQLDEEDHKDGYVEVGEGQTLGDGSPEAVWGEIPEEAGDVEETVADPDHQAATSEGEAEAAPRTGDAFDMQENWDWVGNKFCWRKKWLRCFFVCVDYYCMPFIVFILYRVVWLKQSLFVYNPKQHCLLSKEILVCQLLCVYHSNRCFLDKFSTNLVGSVMC